MKFELEEILAIVEKVSQTELDLFEYKDQDIKLKIRGKQAAVFAQPVQAAAPESEIPGKPEAAKPVPEKRQVSETGQEQEKTAEGVYVESPMVGTFYAAPSQDAEPFVQVGDRVSKGQTVGIVEAMKLMNEIEAECDGVVKEILVKNEQMVEYGQRLIRIAAE